MTDSEKLIKALYSGYNRLLSSKAELDSINVFPVADGDTGSNMSRTLKAGVEAIKYDKDRSFYEIAEKFTKAMLRSARGNSGVILSVLFRGFFEAVKQKNGLRADCLQFCFHNALIKASEALSHPVFQGTMLSIVLAARDCPGDFSTISLESGWNRITAECKKALEKTRKELAQHREKNVVDSGAKGLFLLISAANDVLAGKDAAPVLQKAVVSRIKPIGKSAFGKSEYCTEFIIIKNGFIPTRVLEKKLCAIGSSVAVVSDDDIIKVHVHTQRPNHALGIALHFGSLTDIKIDNMNMQQSDTGQPDA